MVYLEGLADLVAGAALDAVEQAALHRLEHAVALVVGVVEPQGRGDHLRGAGELLEPLLGHHGAGGGAHAAAGAVLERIHLGVDVGVHGGVDLVERHRLGALALHGCGHAVGHLGLVDHQVAHHREARQRGHEVLARLVDQGHAGQARRAVEGHGAAPAVAAAAAEVKDHGGLFVVDGRKGFEQGHRLVPGDVVVDHVGALVDGGIVFLDADLHGDTSLVLDASPRR